jgi:mannose-6-phosphate isomerase
LHDLEKLSTRFLEKVWGSTHLEPLFPNRTERIGEVWFEAGHALPLLIKFIFTTGKLSVQVHPNDHYARLHHGSLGKTEMWHVVAAEPGAQVAVGFREPISRARLREASQSGEIENLLRWYDARPGDTFFLPAGTVHAIGAGLVMCEIQQCSDVTYRLYDYGRPRELHLDHGVEVSDLGPYDARPSHLDGHLVSCNYFTARLLRGGTELAGGTEWMISVIRGAGTIGRQPARAGEGFYVPVQPHAIPVEGDVELLAATAHQA